MKDNAGSKLPGACCIATLALSDVTDWIARRRLVTIEEAEDEDNALCASDSLSWNYHGTVNRYVVHFLVHSSLRFKLADRRYIGFLR